MYTESKEVRSATRCLQPQRFQKSGNDTISFIGCDLSQNQKWAFKPVAVPGTPQPGLFVHIKSGRCLTLPGKSLKRRAEKSVLSFLANMAFETGFNSESPTLENCNYKIELKENENEAQLWLMNSPAEWRHESWDSLSFKRFLKLTFLCIQETGPCSALCTTACSAQCSDLYFFCLICVIVYPSSPWGPLFSKTSICNLWMVPYWHNNKYFWIWAEQNMFQSKGSFII